jgi:hypothetical protein
VLDISHSTSVEASAIKHDKYLKEAAAKVDQPEDEAPVETDDEVENGASTSQPAAAKEGGRGGGCKPSAAGVSSAGASTSQRQPRLADERYVLTVHQKLQTRASAVYTVLLLLLHPISL